ncbi:efflux RND transporter periplasmic adaptor subunit [Chloroflexota bacterium]
MVLTQAKVALVQADVGRDEAEYNLNQLRDVLHASRDRVELAESALNAAGEQLKAAEQTVAEAQKQLDEAIITAPFDGMVASVDIDEGNNVEDITEIIHLVDLTRLELEVEIDEIDISGVKLGQRAIISIDAQPGIELEGKITFIPPLSRDEPGLVLYDVKIGFDAPQDFKLRGGMSATADIVIDERSDVLLVPNRAITLDKQDNPTVMILVDESIQDIKVVIGISDGSHTEILGGLNEGDVVIVKTEG